MVVSGFVCCILYKSITNDPLSLEGSVRPCITNINGTKSYVVTQQLDKVVQKGRLGHKGTTV